MQMEEHGNMLLFRTARSIQLSGKKRNKKKEAWFLAPEIYD